MVVSVTPKTLIEGENMNREPEIECPFCAEIIRKSAKVCPRCRQWLSLRSFRNPIVGAILGLVVVFLMMIFLVGMFRRSFNPPPYFCDTPNVLSVLESQMFFKETTNGPRIYITGIITNQSASAWRDIEFECRFLGTNGSLIDAYTTRCYMTIQGNDDSAFRVTVVPARDFRDYVELRLSVSSARNPKGLF
jgi:hypothetical protein